VPRRTRRSIYLDGLGTDADVSRVWFSDEDLREAARTVSIGDSRTRSGRRIEVIDLEDSKEREEWVRKRTR
jgi:hypothetical protein